MDEPLPIKKLEEHVVNRIAAGEVIQRPANALKEMIENSIDAKSTIIQVIVKEGGLKLLQIIDNGTGIRYDDFNIVCERFTTSKLEKFEDLSNINTYGFRGEALASISHISHLTIQSRTAMQECAYKACYVDSILKDLPKPCAGNVGTVITVEDLFYNMTTRRKAMKNATEEYRKICDVVGKYAIHNSAISFSLKKYGENVTIKTQINSSTLDNIRNIYGNSTAKKTKTLKWFLLEQLLSNLIEVVSLIIPVIPMVNTEQETSVSEVLFNHITNIFFRSALINFELEDKNLKFSAMGYASNFNYSAKKGIFILFINGRLVESLTIKKCIDVIYSTYLPKNLFPFIYLSIKIDPQNVDVNVHPTKQQVNFLYEEQISEIIATHIEQKNLKCNNTSRTFYIQTKLPGAQQWKNDTNDEKNKLPERDDKSFVRTNFTDQKLDKFIITSQHIKSDDCHKKEELILNMSSLQSPQIERKDTNLSSVNRLRKMIEDNCHLALRELISEHVFVGCIDVNRSLIQHNTKLYYCFNKLLLEELFYQILIHNFQNFGTISFSNPLSLKQLILIALDLPESKWTPEDGDKSILAESAVNMLVEKAALMGDYFSLTINSDQNLVSIPLLIDNYIPEVAGLPKYILKLATDVNWKKEQECFDSFSRVTARYYAHREESNKEENINWKWTTEYIIYPSLKKYLLPPKTFAKSGVILQVADLPDLYKVFERC